MELYLGSWLRHIFFLDKIHRLVCGLLPTGKQNKDKQDNSIFPFNYILYKFLSLFRKSEKKKNSDIYWIFFNVFFEVDLV